MDPKEFLARYRPRALYHFTDLENLASIRADGLLSVAELAIRGIVVPKPGGNEWSRDQDRRRGVDSLVHLGFTDNHPMEYIARQNAHIGATRYLQIDPSIMLEAGVMGCATVANRRDAVLLPIAQALDAIDLEILFRMNVNFADPAQRSRYNEAKKAEILIPTRIDVRHIRNL